MASSDSKLVVIRRFARSGEAHVVKSLLDSFGLETELRGEESASLFPDNPISDFGIELIARAEDAAKIDALLAAKFDKSDIK